MEVLTRLLRLLTPGERRELLGVLALAVTAATLEMLAVLSVMPFMAVVADPVGFLDHPAGLWVGEHLGLTQARDILLFGGAGVLALVIGANSLGALSLRRIHLTAWNINHYLSVRLLSTYLSRPFHWFLSRHSSGLNRNILEEVRLLIQGALIPLLTAAVRGVGAVFLVVLLLVVDFRMTLVAGGVLGIAYLVIYLVIRRLQETLGEMRSGATGTRFRVATEVLGGIKEVKSLGVEAEFLRRFERTGPPFVRATAWSLVLSELPRFLLEVLSVGTVLAILLFLITSDRSLGEAIPVLTLFAFAGYKLVPAFHQVFGGMSLARFHLSSLKEIERDLLEDVPPESGTSEGMSPLRMREGLELVEVTLSYPEAPGPSLSGVTLSIKKGERVGIVGPTGAGKTTLVDVLLGLLHPQEGELRVDGIPVDVELWRRWRASVGYVPQSIFLSDDSIAGNIAFGRRPEEIDRDQVAAAARLAELHDFIETLPAGFETEVGERGVRLSGGQRQRIGIARALYRDPTLLLLDEATSALDGATEEAVMDAVFGLERERTVVIVAHRLSTVRRCDRIVVLNGGRVEAQGSWDELFQESDLFRVLVRSAS